jgi:hypothetical protein
MVILRRWQNQASNGKMTYVSWIGNDLDGSRRRLIEVPSQHFPAGTEENHEKTHGSGVQAEIRSEYLPNTSLESYRYENPLNHDVKLTFPFCVIKIYAKKKYGWVEVQRNAFVTSALNA